MEALAQDLRHAFRQLVRRPGFTAVAVLSLALGIGGNAIIFAFFDGFVLHPFAYPEPDRVVAIGSTFPRMSSEERFIEAISLPQYVDIQSARTHRLDRRIRWRQPEHLGRRSAGTGGDDARDDRPVRPVRSATRARPRVHRAKSWRRVRRRRSSVTGSGRVGSAGPGHRRHVGESEWRTDHGGRRDAAGAPDSRRGSWLPWRIDPNDYPRNRRPFTLIARLAPGATLEEANAELATIAARTTAAHAAEFEEYQGWRLTATPWSRSADARRASGAWLLLGAVGLVLLIACANLSNLFLARSSTRQREMAVRLALGAARWRIARHLLAEVALLTIAGLGAGLLLAQVGLPALVSVVPAQLNTFGVTAAINVRVVGWAAMFAIGSAALVAVLPVFQSTRTSPQDALKSDGRGATAGRVPLRLRHSLIVAEIALSVILLVGAGLWSAVSRGFRMSSPASTRQRADDAHYLAAGEVSRRRDQRVLPANAGSPRSDAGRSYRFGGFAVSSAGLLLDSVSPGFDDDGRRDDADVADHGGKRDPLHKSRRAAGRRAAIRGDRSPRRATRRDCEPGIRVEVLSGAEALGRRLSIGPADRPSPPMEIVGIVANTQNRDMRNPPSPEIFVPLHQQTQSNQLFLLVRTTGEAGGMLSAVREQLATIDPDQPVYNVQTLEAAVSAANFGNRFSMVLFAIFAAVALSLTMINVAARIASSARRITLHLPLGWPWQHHWAALFDKLCGPPATTP